MKSFTVNNLKIHDVSLGETLGYLIHSPVSGLDFPAIRLSSYDKPGEHGAVVSNQLYGARQVDLTGAVFGNSILEFNSRRRALSAAVGVIRQNFLSLALTCKYTSDDGLNLQFDAYLKNIKMDDEHLTHANFMLTLFAPDPNIYDQNLSSVVMSPRTGGGILYPVTYPATYGVSSGGYKIATNSGDASTYPIFYFNGPLTSPSFLNLNTGETFKVNATIPSGSQLVVDMSKKTMVFNNVTNYMYAYDLSNTWISFVPGNNILILSTSNSGDTGNLDIAFRSAYIGT